ncbi:MFS transporter [Actinoallomurus bryophytorum]|uniref:DHA1 family inner membrane transport protein n=1 Tax=Actinoallomurus bryophytorum TaxID=1490222 RepID=A0A543CHX6_9ACTN|nr:MFS transporter [Actinoallomurus bryophytorum]TQL96685.1 DHA1 family inner membrane transport protein [Actinoallomurus bryophytorum]
MNTLTTTGQPATPTRSEGPASRRAVLAIAALALGSFAIGTNEFVSMGLLPEITRGVGVDIPTGGHLISAYAVGVVIGAPVIAALGARLPRRRLALGLMVAFLLGNALTALAPNYGMLLPARLVAGLPHGAYFGVASLIAASLVRAEVRGRAVSSVMLGLAVANVAGVPAATWLGQHLGWRAAYWSVAVIAGLTVLSVLLLVPSSPVSPGAGMRTELGALRRPQVLLTLLTGVVGFGGMFAMYSYIAPTVTDVAGASPAFVPIVLLAFGVGGVAGTALGGRLADRALFPSLAGAGVAMGAVLALMLLAAHSAAYLALAVLGVAAAGSVMVVCLQMRLMEVAGEAQMLGAALNHSALNLANALGAWLGGLVIAAGEGYTAPSLVGAGLSVLGLAALGASAVVGRRERRAAAA